MPTRFFRHRRGVPSLASAFTAACLSVACAYPMAAQAAYINSTRAEPYVRLADLPGITGVTSLTFSSVDDGQAALTLPFAFDFLGTTFTTVNIGSNGYMTFGGDSASSLTNQIPGTASAPNNWIAPLWDDLLQPSTNNARWGVIGGAPNRAVVIEAGPGTRYPASGGTLFHQIWLFEGPDDAFEFRSTGAPVNALSATIGYEGAAGAFGFDAGGCGNTCSAVPDGITFRTEFVADVEQPPNPVSAPSSLLLLAGTLFMLRTRVASRA